MKLRKPRAHRTTSAYRFVLSSAMTILTLLVTDINPFAQTVKSIYSFSGQNSSAAPSNVTPTQGRDGSLYGTTFGLGGSSYGTIFKVAQNGAFKQLYTFDSITGSQPNAGITLAGDGNFYGTASSGGNSNGGVLFRTTATGIYTTLHNFAGGSDGIAPASPPVVGTDGNLYGTTNGNTTTASTIYKYALTTGAFTTIYQFDQAHGQSVVAPLIQATDGNLYGTSYQGGANGCGTIFKVTTSGTPLWYYSFPCSSAGGANPIGPLAQAVDGNFYGTTSQGGNPGLGTVFKLNKDGVVSILYNFQGFFGGASDGSTPYGGLVQAIDGKLYGTTTAGGSQNLGTLFQITTNGAYKLLYSFNDNSGSGPSSSLSQRTNGLLYGTAIQGGRFGFGTVYSLDMGLGAFVALVRYQGKADSTVQILGQGLAGTTSVTFNGVACSFRVVSDTYMTAVVPSGATSGPVVVTAPSGMLTSNKSFRIIGGSTSAARTKSSQSIPRAAKKTN